MSSLASTVEIGLNWVDDKCENGASQWREIGGFDAEIAVLEHRFLLTWLVSFTRNTNSYWD